MTTRASDCGTVRDDPPVANDFGLVVRVVGGVAFLGPVDQGLPNIDANSWPVHQVGPLPAGANTIGFVGIDPAANVVGIDPAANSVGITGWFGSAAPTVGQKVMADSLPVTLASDQPAIPVTATITPSTVGTEGNAWNAAAVGAGATSNVIDCQYTPFVSCFGITVGGPTTITVQVSQDGVAFYNAVASLVAPAGNFCIGQIIGARYVRLRTSAASTITATIAGKS